MFKEYLQPIKCDFKVHTAKILQIEMLSQIKAEAPAVAVVGFLACRRLTHIRYLCKKIHAEAPKQKILVGCWGLDAKADQLRQRLQASGVTDVGVTFQESLDQLTPLLHLTAAPEKNGALADSKR